jgi:hypothetical protein
MHAPMSLCSSQSSPQKSKKPQTARTWPEHLAGTQQIILKYLSMDAADASLVSFAEMSPKAALVTTDRRDFMPCRGLRNRTLNLILPE